MKKVRLSEDAYILLKRYREELSKELGRRVSYDEAIARLLRKYERSVHSSPVMIS
ncbi:MAG: hypothetical protein GXN93_04775 [Candidatus Diapherotrites archaeon]|nr:hypothetical protein [Candidatus Diapherotrites archaeon]